MCKKVIACFNGHNHDDNHTELNGIHYIRINSTSYKWVGDKYGFAGRYDEKTNESRPSLKYTIPYTEAIFAIVEIDSKGILTIRGNHSSFVPPGPKELGITEDVAPPSISNRELNF